MKSGSIKIAVVQYEIEHLTQWQAFEDKIVRLVEQVKENDADLLLLSEYAGLELAGWETSRELNKQFAHIQTQLNAYQQLFSYLAQHYQLYIQPGTLPVKEQDGSYRNRAYVFSPHGKIGYQDKIHLTPFEITTGLFQPGTQLNIFTTPQIKFAIMICYDCEFPLVAKQLNTLGTQLILVPSCTERISGLTRVAVSSQARAIENQCYVAQSSLVGKSSWNDFIDINTGKSTIYSPADTGFPENGILVEAPLNAPITIYADLAFEKLEQVRRNGEMRNYSDMQQDITKLLQSTNTIDLGLKP